MKVGELLELGLGRVAWKMNEMISTFTEEEASKFCESWAKKEDGSKQCSDGEQFASIQCVR